MSAQHVLRFQVEATKFHHVDDEAVRRIVAWTGWAETVARRHWDATGRAVAYVAGTRANGRVVWLADCTVSI